MTSRKTEEGIVAQLRSGTPAFILTAVFAAIAWWVTHTVDRISSAPILEYQLDSSSVGATSNCKSPCNMATFRVENLSSELFENLELELTTESGRFDSPGKLTAVGRYSAPDDEALVGNGDFAISWKHFYPGGMYIARARYSGRNPASVFVRASPKAIKLIKPSLETTISRHENAFLSVAIVSLMTLAAIVLTGRIVLPILVAIGFSLAGYICFGLIFPS